MMKLYFKFALHKLENQERDLCHTPPAAVKDSRGKALDP